MKSTPKVYITLTERVQNVCGPTTICTVTICIATTVRTIDLSILQWIAATISDSATATTRWMVDASIVLRTWT
jgi:hypothetical protein